MGERLPCLTYGMRGMISLSIEVRGPARDLHSGNEGGVFTEPLADLSKVQYSTVPAACVFGQECGWCLWARAVRAAASIWPH